MGERATACSCYSDLLSLDSVCVCVPLPSKSRSVISSRFLIGVSNRDREMCCDDMSLSSRCRLDSKSHWRLSAHWTQSSINDRTPIFADSTGVLCYARKYPKR
jgi:hypothetical protein